MTIINKWRQVHDLLCEKCEANVGSVCLGREKDMGSCNSTILRHLYNADNPTIVEHLLFMRRGRQKIGQNDPELEQLVDAELARWQK